MTYQIKTKNKKAFTLMELLVSVLILIFVFIGFFSISRVISSNQSSKSSDVSLLDNANYFLKVFRDSIADAQMGNGSLCGIPEGKFFLSDEASYIDFIKDGRCHSFDLDHGRIAMRVGGESNHITSKDLSINNFKIIIDDNIDLRQPMVTISFNMTKGEEIGSKISAQTSVSLNYLIKGEEEEENGEEPESDGVIMDYELRNDDGSYFCADLTISTTSQEPILWQYFLDISKDPFRIANIEGSWNFDYIINGNIMTIIPSYDWAETVVAGSPVTGLSFCATREDGGGEEEDYEAILDYIIRDDNGLSYCVDFTISTQSPTPIVWNYNLDISNDPFKLVSITDSWFLNYNLSSNNLSISGSGNNNTVVAGSPVSGLGFCADRVSGGGGEENEHGVIFEYSLREDNGSSYCADIIISTLSPDPIVWSYDLDASAEPFEIGAITGSWNMNYTLNSGVLSISGLENNNDTVVAGSPRSGIGFCATRDFGSGDNGTVSYNYVIDNDWGAGYNATITVSTESTKPVKWSIEVDLSTAPLNGTATNVWNASWSFVSPILYATGVGWNDYVSAGNPVSFGFGASR